MNDWPLPPSTEVPPPALVAAWLSLNSVSPERIPLWAAYWIADGYDGPNLIRLAGLSGADPHEVRDVLPDALADLGLVVPATTEAAMTAFTALAQLHASGRAGERWIVDKVYEIATEGMYSRKLTDLPLGSLFELRDEWDEEWGRSEAELVERVRRACREQLALAGAGGSPDA